MLIRAMLISVLLHLVILISPIQLDGRARTRSLGDGANALSVVIGWRRGGDSLESGTRKSAMVKDVAGVRQSSQPPKSTTGHSNFGPFFRSTVEPVDSGSEKSVQSLEVAATDALATSAEEIGRYRLTVARSARQFKVYPPLAREKGWEGVVHVTVAMPAGLGTPTVSLANSSGYEVLDRQAVEMVTQAVSLAVLPEGMRGRRMSISLPVEYRVAE